MARIERLHELQAWEQIAADLAVLRHPCDGICDRIQLLHLEDRITTTTADAMFKRLAPHCPVPHQTYWWPISVAGHRKRYRVVHQIIRTLRASQHPILGTNPPEK